jgi:diaminohydroxyphosphoribosylaminopyrimidine deaminase / 5-amino-6-(5-phosphoribosylamino)uracil reductase
MTQHIDKKFMLSALTLAKKGFGKTSPNPMVGALIVKNGRIIGKGYHKCAGTAHAEINAIADAGKAKCNGATLYVTLEPCSTVGKTPPCTEAVIAAKFAKVVIGCLDANPAHAGKAVTILQEAGMETVVGIEEEKCRELNIAFFYWIETGRPYVLLKMAMTLDGKIATASGKSKWITGPDARKRVQKLRKWADAIMVGGETVRKDKPSLTVRSAKSPNCELRNWRQPERIIVSNSMTAEKAAKLLPAGKPPIVANAKSRKEWLQIMKKLGEQNITALLVEGGGELAASMLKMEVVNKVEFYIAPKILGGKHSRPVIGGASPDSLTEALNLKNVKVKKIGDDICVSAEIELQCKKSNVK